MFPQKSKDDIRQPQERIQIDWGLPIPSPSSRRGGETRRETTSEFTRGLKNSKRTWEPAIRWVQRGGISVEERGKKSLNTAMAAHARTLRHREMRGVENVLSSSAGEGGEDEYSKPSIGWVLGERRHH